MIENYQLTRPSLLIAVTFTALAIALSSAIIFSLMMEYSRKNSRGIDYAIQSSLLSLSRIIFADTSGLIVSSFGFERMFLFELFGIFVVIFIIYKFYESK